MSTTDPFLDELRDLQRVAEAKRDAELAANDAPRPITITVPRAAASGAQVHTRHGARGLERLRLCGCGAEVWCGLQAEPVCEVCLPTRRRETRLMLMAPAFASIPEGFAWARLDAPTLAQRVARPEFIAALTDALDLSGLRALFVGRPGSGKTSLAVAYLRSWLLTLADREATPAELREARAARFVATYDLAAATRETKLGGTPALVAEALGASVLVLDELGAEPADGYAVVYRILHERHARNLTTLATTGQTMADLTKCYGTGIGRRLTERVLTFDLGGTP